MTKNTELKVTPDRPEHHQVVKFINGLAVGVDRSLAEIKRYYQAQGNKQMLEFLEKLEAIQVDGHAAIKPPWYHTHAIKFIKRTKTRIG